MTISNNDAEKNNANTGPIGNNQDATQSHVVASRVAEGKTPNPENNPHTPNANQGETKPAAELAANTETKPIEPPAENAVPIEPAKIDTSSSNGGKETVKVKIEGSVKGEKTFPKGTPFSKIAGEMSSASNKHEYFDSSNKPMRMGDKVTSDLNLTSTAKSSAS